jgi:hypothetical protein
MSIRAQLSELDKYMEKVNFDIEKFNHHVDTLMERLAARGQTTHDLISNLFRAYKTVKDHEFMRYITQKESDFEEGAINLNAELLMQMAQTRFEVLQDKKLWRAPTDEEQKIVALEAKLKRFERASQPRKGNDNKTQGPRTKDNRRNATSSKQSKDPRPRKELPAWCHVAPKPGEPQTKTVDGAEWKYCANHQRWCKHSTAECTSKGLGSKPAGKPADSKHAKTKWNPRLIQAKKATVKFTDLAADSDSDTDE